MDRNEFIKNNIQNLDSFTINGKVKDLNNRRISCPLELLLPSEITSGDPYFDPLCGCFFTSVD